MEKVNFKNTLNLPKTQFAMKADLPQNEPKIESLWEEKKIYEKVRKKNISHEKFILHDGPPYANGDIHIGHALNKILKDFIIRYKTMNGFSTPFLPGWDCHGLPVELQLLKQLDLKKHEVNKKDFRKKAGEFALKFVDIQKGQFRRLGIFGEWDRPYLTLDKKYEAEILRTLAGLVRQGFIYRSLKPVNWCCHCETALAEAEVEYQDITSPSIFVKFEVKDRTKVLKKEKGEIYLVIWTTTPWTLLANAAVAVSPNLRYCFVKAGEEIWIIAKDLIEKVMQAAGLKNYEILKDVSSDEIEGLEYSHPFFDRKGKVVLADYVSKEEGSGIVHTAPGHGQEDYITGLKYNLPVIMPVDEKGRFDEKQGEFSGLHVKKADAVIIEKLAGLKRLIKALKVIHAYPHCWRCKNPVIFRATSQYFLKIDHNDLRKKLLSIVNNEVKWIPIQGRERICTMIENRPDWCLSRQRLWGIPIPAFYCRNCKMHILNADIIEHTADLVEERGTEIWFSKEEKELLPTGFKCPHCGKRDFLKEEDILDVWFESGASFKAVLKKDSALGFPADLYLEGSDQHRGWFQSSLINSAALEGRAPYKQVLTHGFVVDGLGRKMSKSVGNVVTPHQIIQNKGADILRLWVASSDYNEDVRISEEIMNRLAEAYRKIRNTFRFLLGNLYDFNAPEDLAGYEEQQLIDKWALSKLSALLEEVDGYYQKYDFLKVYQTIYHFCVVELSSFYLDIIKDRLYTFASKDMYRRSIQTTLFYILDVLTRILAPVIPFTAEEVWQCAGLEQIESVHLLDWPDVKKWGEFKNEKLEKEFEKIFCLRKDVLKKIEEKREAGIIGNSLEAKIFIFVKANSENRQLLENYREQLTLVFIVSQVEIETVTALNKGEVCQYFQDAAVKVERADGAKCARCWNYFSDVGEKKEYPEVCSRCAEVLKG